MSETLYSTRGHITAIRGLDDIVQRAATDEDAASLLSLAKERALSPESFDRYPPVFFTVNASTNSVDAYSTIMGDTTLSNFALDAAEGRSVLDSHNSSENGFGRSLTGDVVKEASVSKVRSSFFTIANYSHRGMDTNSLIAGIETGLHSDISVGFYIPAGEGRMTCSICGEDMLDWESCRHFAGLNYLVDTDGGPENRVAIGTIENARLSEYSLVYDGATPGAAVVKALRLTEAGEVDAPTVERLQRQYRREFPIARSWTLTDNASGMRVVTNTEKETPGMLDKLMDLATERGIRIRTGADEEAVLAAFEAHLNGLETDRTNAEENTAAAIAERDALTAEITANAPLVEDGRAYRERCVEDAIDAQTRTLTAEAAKTYKRDVHKRYFENMEIEDLLELTRTYNDQSQFKPGALSRKDGSSEPTTARAIVPGATRLHQD